MMRPRISRKQDSGHARTHRFLDHSVPKLDFSTELSPPCYFVGERGTPKRHESHCDPVQVENFDSTIRLSTPDRAFEDGLVQAAVEIGGQAASKQAVTVTAPIHHPPTENHSPRAPFSSHHDGTIEEPAQAHQRQTRNLDASPGIRERKGWLKAQKEDRLCRL